MHLSLTLSPAQHFIQAFSWMLLHSLWQGLIAAALTGALFAIFRRSSASVKYNLALVQFLLFVAGCVYTFIREWQSRPESIVIRPVVGAIHAGGAIPLGLNIHALERFARLCLSDFSANAPMVVLLWLIFFVFRSFRMIGGLMYTHRAKRRHLFQPTDEWRDKLDKLSKKLKLNKVVRLLESGYVKMPMVIGNMKPIILIPVGMLAGLPAGQVEAILLHELAHIRRNDYFVNLLQTAVETVYFFNPGLLWVSALIREERENCCDDAAIAQTKNKKEFVQALISFKEHALYANNYKVAFPGKKNHLLNRVKRIIGGEYKTFGAAEKAALMACFFVLFAIVATATITRAGVMRHNHSNVATKMVYRAPKKIAHVLRQVNVSPSSTTKRKKAPFYTKAKPVLRKPELSIATDEVKHETVAVQADAHAETVAVELPKVQPISQEEQARRDKQQAIVDQEQAAKDQLQAKKDQAEALLDQAQARKDQAAAKRDQEQALLNQEQAGKNQEQSERNSVQVQQNNIQETKNREQAERNRKQQVLNEMQAAKNKEQAKRNEKQAIKNQEQDSTNRKLAISSHVSVQ